MTFEDILRLRLVSRALCDFLEKLFLEIPVNKLQELINNNWSLVDSFKDLPQEHKIALTEDIPSVQIIKFGITPEAFNILLENADEILDRTLTKLKFRLPEHTQILKENPQWLESEMIKIKNLTN